MEEVEGQTDKVIFDHLHATAFQYTPLGKTILGPAQNIKTITKYNLQKYISTHYPAPRMVIATSGAVKHEDIVEQVKKLVTVSRYFNIIMCYWFDLFSFPPNFHCLSLQVSKSSKEVAYQFPFLFLSSKSLPSQVSFKSSYLSSKHLPRSLQATSKKDPPRNLSTKQIKNGVCDKALGSTNCAVLVNFTKLSTDPTTASELVAKEQAIFTGSEVRIIDDDIPLAQFAVAFNGASWTNPDSIAFMRVGINEIAENMMAFNTNYKDTGLFGVYAIAKPDSLDDLAYAIMYEMSNSIALQLKSSLLLHIDGTCPIAEDIGRQLLTYRRSIPFVELFARIDAVDASTVKRVANRFIFDQDVAITAMGLIQGLPYYNWFRRRTYWLRY
ncbi:hypothetical protein ACSBR1_021836 [Camellia fascicularis]